MSEPKKREKRTSTTTSIPKSGPAPLKRRGRTFVPLDVINKLLKAHVSGIPPNARLTGVWTREGIAEMIFVDESFELLPTDTKPPKFGVVIPQ